MALRPITRLRRICLALPEAHEVETWGAPTFRVRNKIFAMYASSNTHAGGGRPGVWCKAAPGEQAAHLQRAPDRFFIPPYVGPSGWVGIWLDGQVDWDELAGILLISFRLVAPKGVLELLEQEE
jgi:predicted DNA-binding protein (MmcQ/YjbR family)